MQVNNIERHETRTNRKMTKPRVPQYEDTAGSFNQLEFKNIGGRQGQTLRGSGSGDYRPQRMEQISGKPLDRSISLNRWMPQREIRLTPNQMQVGINTQLDNYLE